MVWDIRCNKRDGYYKPVNTIHNCHSTLSTTGTPQRNKRRGRRLSSVAKPVRDIWIPLLKGGVKIHLTCCTHLLKSFRFPLGLATECNCSDIPRCEYDNLSWCCRWKYKSLGSEEKLLHNLYRTSSLPCLSLSRSRHSKTWLE